MRILLLTFYFPPDLCAGSFRAAALAEGLIEESDRALTIDVLTTRPNRYRSFSVEAPEFELRGRMRIRRLPVSVHESGMADQSRAFASYAYQVLRVTGGENYDLVLATSSRLMTAVLAAVVARRLSAPLYLDIRDLFIDTMQDLLRGRPLRQVLPAFKIMERYALGTAKKVSFVSAGFEDYLLRMVPRERLRCFPNGIDDEVLRFKYENPTPNPRPLILYAGNVGHGQGLHRIIPEVARWLRHEVDFVIVGDGSARRELELELATAALNNVQLLPPMPRSKLLAYYRQADILFLHLNDYGAFRKVLPSKVFEYAATGKPLLAGVSGYARTFILENIQNAAVFDPCDAEGFIRAMRSLHLAHTPRDDFVSRFRRKSIVRAMARDILAVASERADYAHVR